MLRTHILDSKCFSDNIILKKILQIVITKNQ